MKYVLFLSMTCGLLAQAIAFAQGSSNSLWYENGSMANHAYANECFGFSMAIPEGWQSNIMGSDGKARHIPGGGLALLILRQSQGNTIILTARDVTGAPPTAQEFVSTSVQAQVNADKEHRELLHDAVPVDYGGKHFFRADYKQSINGQQLYSAFVYTKFRAYYIGATLVAESSQELDETAKNLQPISFQSDEPNPNCVMKGDDSATGIAGGVIGADGPPSRSGQPLRVRVSQGVSQGLLIKRVNPVYPDEARHGRIQGQVVLQVEIDQNGDMRNVTLVSGHPLLAPAAIEAVKQWKYKPYLLEGQPVVVETQVTVNFTLSGG